MVEAKDPRFSTIRTSRSRLLRPGKRQSREWVVMFARPTLRDVLTLLRYESREIQVSRDNPLSLRQNPWADSAFSGRK